jgi:hypothetical protein
VLTLGARPVVLAVLAGFSVLALGALLLLRKPAG